MNKYRLLALLSLFALLAAPLPGVDRALAEPAPTLAAEGAAVETGVPADWWAAVQDEIRRAEYEITGVDGAYQAPNRAHNLRTYFDASGPLVTPRLWPEGTETPPWRWGLRLAAWGWEGALQPVGAPTLHPDGSRMEYHYPAQSSIVEWYVNDERGLEQGFTISDQASAASGQPANVVLELHISGDLVPRLASDDQAVEFSTAAGARVLRYTNLHAYDATGRALPASLSLSPFSISIHVDATAAAYPLTIDPLLATPGWTFESSQADAQMGTSVASAGDLNNDGYDDIVVGAPYFDSSLADRGLVLVFYGSETGPPANYSVRLDGSTAGARLGEVVGCAGDVNGDTYDDLIASAPGAGYVAVYYGSDSGLQGPWLASGPTADYFGVAASTAGDVNGDNYDDLIVGAMNADPLADDSGAAYVWYGSYTGLGDPGTPANADWSAASGQENGRLGRSAAAAGDLNGDHYDDIVVGANGYDNPEGNEGAIFVWYGSNSGLGNPGLPSNADWWAQSNQANAYLGTAAGTAGDINGDGYSDLIAGAYAYDGAQSNGGRAYVFYSTAAGLSCGGGCPVDANIAADWTADGRLQGAYLGAAAATAGDVDGDGYDDVVLGAPYDDSGQDGAGRAYLYRGSATGLSHDAAWSEGGGQENETYGWSAAGAGDVNGDGSDDLLVGAPFYDSAQANGGRANLYYGSPLALLTEAAWSAQSGHKGAHLGSVVDTAGDLNGDSFSDVVVGAPDYDSATLGGRVFVYYGSAAGLPGAASWTATSDQALGEFGAAAATAGDLNGDGYADLAVGAPDYDHDGLGGAGAAFVYLGSAGGLGDPGSPANADWAVYGDQAGARLGYDLGTAGDVNRDNRDDLIVGAPFYNAEWGRVYVYHGGAEPDTTADWWADSPQAEGNFGYAVDTAGDINRDGYADVIVGAPHAAYAYVYYGSTAGLAAAPSWESFNTQGSSQHGYAVAAAGDTNGDGYADILIGAPDYDNDGLDRGRVYVCFGAAMLPTCTWLFDGSQDNGHFGRAVSTAGDVNGDGYADILAAEPFADGDWADEGRAYLYYGGLGFPDAGHGWAVRGRANSRLGSALGTAGDVNGDGYADVIVGAPLYSDAEMQEGWAAVYYGAPARPGAKPDWLASETQADTHLGDAVGTAGDVDADGYADVIVGAPLYDGGQTDEGKVYVYLGDAGGLDTDPAWTAESNQAGARFGAALGAAGDVNGDGYGDVAVGAPAYDDTSVDEGRAFVWFGSETGLGANGTPANADWQFWGTYSQNYLGTSVGTAGDVNGDGFGDLILGAPGFDGSELDQGRVCVFHGSAAGLSGVAWEKYGDQASAFLGSDVGTAGDVNGDGFSDAVLGASNYSGAEVHEGRAYVYHGSTNGLAATPAATLQGSFPNAYFGGSVDTAGDVDGDGYADVIVGARALSQDQLYEGRAYVYFGSATGLSGGGAPWWVEGNQFGAYLGSSVAGAGDVNGDGYADVIVGADGYDAGESNEGRVYLYFGSPDGPGYAPDWQAEGNDTDVHLGLAVGSAGDVNGDGYADLIIGSGGYSSGGDPDKQGAYVVHGNDGGGHADQPLQTRLDWRPLAPLGLSDSCSAVKLVLNTWMPLGRERIKLEWQIAPLGTPFDAASGVISGIRSSWAESQSGTAAFSPEVSGLSGATAYHWRVRLVYDPGNRLGQAAGPWKHVPWNAWTELDFRTPLCYVYLPLIVR